jgi:hypothetical protein
MKKGGHSVALFCLDRAALLSAPSCIRYPDVTAAARIFRYPKP